MRGRFAPSPTGYIHLGNVWSALLAWLQVRQAGGTLVLRIEDIDEQRSKPIYTQALMEDLHWTAMMRPWRSSIRPASCIPAIAAGPACRLSALPMPASTPFMTAIATV